MKKINKNLARGIGGIFIVAIFSFFHIAQASDISVDRVIQLVNESRKSENVLLLSENETLAKIAEDKLDDMIKNNYFAHTSPQGITPWHWYEKNKYDYKYAGENLAINFVTAEKQHEAWMKSETHKRNILNANYQEIGVAVAAGEINGQLSIITVQEFGTLATAIAKNNEKNFSGQEKTNLVEVGKKIAPTVLSVKEIKNIESDRQSSQGNKVGEYIAKNKISWSYQLEAVALFLLVVSSLVAPLVLALDYINKSWVLILRKNEESVLIKVHVIK